jgi:AraC-like DNA-binding protein
MMTINNLLYIGIAISIFSIFLALSKKPNQISDKIFVAFLLSIIIPMMISLIPSVELSQLILIRRLDDFMPLTLGPFIAIYAESLTKTDYVLTKKSLYHFSPFLFFFIAGSCYIHFTSFDVGAINSLNTDPFQLPFSIVFLLSIVGYSIWVPLLLKKHRTRVLDYYAHNSNYISLIWLARIVYIAFIFFAIAHLPILLNSIHPSLLNSHSEVSGHNVRVVGFVAFLCALSFFGVRQTQVFTIISPPIDDINDEVETEDLSASSDNIDSASTPVRGNSRSPIIHDDQLQEYLEKLEDYVKVQKPYLDSELTLGSLASMLNIPKHHLTETLNRKLQKNFYSYINEHRLDDVKMLLLDSKNSSESILSLAYQSGFNSKSTFNNFFKKSTRMTPSQFRKSSVTEKLV